MQSDPSNSDELFIVDEPEIASVRPVQVWRVLVVDDDEDVHKATSFALKAVTILDRPIKLIHAYSAADALEKTNDSEEIAVALIDVVLETPEAGLKLVGQLREAGFQEMRIVLRTGQPGYAPELSVISHYEIDDYRTKDELTRMRLLTVLTSSIRAYDQIRTITRSRVGLELIVKSATKLFKRTNLELFSRGVLTQITALLRIAPNGIVSVNNGPNEPVGNSHVISAMGRFAQYIGKPTDAIVDSRVYRLLNRARERAELVFEDGYTALHFNNKLGRELWVVIESEAPVSPEGMALLKVFSTNIAAGFENLALVEKLDRLAYLDPVLKVPNLNAFELALVNKLASDEPGGRMALMHVDSFHSISASYGTRVAHGLLTAIYESLVGDHQAAITVARTGDGSFALLGDSDTLNEHLIRSAFERTYHVHGVDLTTTATTAMVDLGDTETDASMVLQAANAALLHVQQADPGKCVQYDMPLRAAVERRIQLQKALRFAIERKQGLFIYMQPKVNLFTGKVIGAEALMRWTYDGNAISPVEFIPIAESAGLIQQLTEFVVQAVGDWVKQRAGKEPMPVAINLSMKDLNNPGFANRLLGQIANAGLSPETVEFEVTEGVAMQEASWAIEQVRALQDQHYRIALDDFGTGYSSLGNFERLPINILKLDRSFVHPLTEEVAQSSLAAVVFAMTQVMDVDCIAEGVETSGQKKILMDLGFSIGQGYLLGRPVPLQDFEERFLA